MQGGAICDSLCPLVVGPPSAATNEQQLACPAYCSLMNVLSTVWKYPNLRPGQLEVVLPVLHGHDVFVRMATGAGKSLCMFLAPLAAQENGIGVVISPLNGLMDEQVLEYGIPCQIVVHDTRYEIVMVHFHGRFKIWHMLGFLLFGYQS